VVLGALRGAADESGRALRGRADRGEVVCSPVGGAEFESGPEPEADPSLHVGFHGAIRRDRSEDPGVDAWDDVRSRCGVNVDPERGRAGGV